MGKIFGISDMPVAKPFPSLEYGLNNSVQKPAEYVKPITRQAGTYVKKNNASKKHLLKQFFSRVKH